MSAGNVLFAMQTRTSCIPVCSAKLFLLRIHRMMLRRVDRIGQDRAGQGMAGQERAGQSGMGQGSTGRRHDRRGCMQNLADVIIENVTIRAK